MDAIAVRETIAHAGRTRGTMTGPVRSDGGDEEISPEEMWRSIHDIEFSHHFTRWIAILELDQEGVWPLNSTAVRRRVREMTGADIPPTAKSVLTSMRRFEDVGALKRCEVKGQSGDHWYPTEEGYQFSFAIAGKWNRALGCDEAVEALRACADDESDSTDSSE